MGYVVDFVLDVMSAISSKTPVLFQRDGQLFIVSDEGFGKVSYGLNIASDTSDDLNNYNAIKDRSKFILNEKAYFDTMAFGPDTRQFTLDGLTKIASKLSALPDDGKVRMISHNERYHSHKHGYAADGIDVWVENARVMDKSRYLYQVRENESNLLKELDNFRLHVESQNSSFYPSEERYAELLKFDCTIMTPYMVVSLPRKVDIKKWTKDTDLYADFTSSENGGISNYHNLSRYATSPFGVYINLFPHNINLVTGGEDILNKMGSELSQVQSKLNNVSDVIATLNNMHNKIFKKTVN